MRFAEFIERDMEAILQEWEEFAATLLPAAASMTPLALRDHAKQILEAVAADMRTAQSERAQVEKSRGQASAIAGSPETAAQTHAILRARSGFDINQLVAEYRALRASALRRWTAAIAIDEHSFEDMVRFNEAIDQAIVESISFFHTQVEQSRNLLLGMLGHDMRSPLNTILMTASYLTALNAGKEVSEAATLLIRSGASMRALLEDLVDFNRTKLGLGLNINVGDIDLAEVLRDEVEQLRGAHTERQIELDIGDSTEGQWDGRRLQQLLRNLVGNALKYGNAATPVRVSLKGDDQCVRLEVANEGQSMDQAALEELFDPLKRGPAQEDGGLGLGLFIVREITRAHGGELTVRCNAKETVFNVMLPRVR
jgi:signal transduction histidine kinase